MSPGRIAATLAALVVVVRAIVRRRRGRIGRRKVAAWSVLAAALAVYAAGVLPQLPSPELILGGVAAAIGPYAYVLVGVLAYLETAAFLGFLTPGELTVVLGGVVAARGDVSLVPLIGLVWLCSALGDATGYVVGRRLGRSFLVRHGERFHLGADRLDSVERFYERRGGAAVVLARFFGPMRTIAPFVAGSSRMPFPRFVPYTLLGTGLYSATFCLLGYFFYASFATVAEFAGRTGGVLAATVAVVGGAVYAYRRLRSVEERRRLEAWWVRQSRRPAVAPLARAAEWVVRRVLLPLGRTLSGPARFVLDRLTPGSLGIELTSTLATAAVGFYVFGLYVWLLAPDPRLLTPLDGFARSVVGLLPRGVLVDLVSILTEIGSSTAIGVLVGATVVWLAVGRRFPEAAALLVGYALVFASLQLVKPAVARPRPPEALAGPDPSSYPSGHAAYAVALVALALVVARRAPGAVRPVAVVAIGLFLTGLVGLSRVYLGQHYLSDVSGGWGLGAGVFGICGAVAIVAGHLAPAEPAPMPDAPRLADDTSVGRDPPSGEPPEGEATLGARGTQA